MHDCTCDIIAIVAAGTFTPSAQEGRRCSGWLGSQPWFGKVNVHLVRAPCLTAKVTLRLVFPGQPLLLTSATVWSPPSGLTSSRPPCEYRTLCVLFPVANRPARVLPPFPGSLHLRGQVRDAPSHRPCHPGLRAGDQLFQCSVYLSRRC